LVQKIDKFRTGISGSGFALNLTGLYIQRRVQRECAIAAVVQTEGLFVAFLLCFTSGVLYHHIPTWLAFLKGSSREASIIVGVARMPGCLILFFISAVVTRLK
jgi:hypothetical protein